MVRPKSSRMGQSKRNRTSFQEEKINAKLRDYDILADSLLANLESAMMDRLNEVTRLVKTEKNRIPKRILQMKMSDLALQPSAKTIIDLDRMLVEQSDTANSSQLSQQSIIKSVKTEHKKLSKDDGYLTEESVTGNPYSEVTASAKARGYGPLASAMKNRRRSKSISGNSTPSWGTSSSLLTGIKSKKTFAGSQSLFGGGDGANPRESRPKLRTPLITGGGASRLQTVSADRGMQMIAPKVQPNTPLAILRHARRGESVYSLTGSPVITAAMFEECANVNIPVANGGVLSIRPTEMDGVDSGLLLQNIDQDTLEHLKKLQINLNKIMAIAEEHNSKK